MVVERRDFTVATYSLLRSIGLGVSVSTSTGIAGMPPGGAAPPSGAPPRQPASNESEHRTSDANAREDVIWNPAGSRREQHAPAEVSTLAHHRRHEHPAAAAALHANGPRGLTGGTDEGHDVLRGERGGDLPKLRLDTGRIRR